MEILQIISSTAFLGAERVICELASNSTSRMHVCLLGAKPSLVEEFRKSLGEKFHYLHNIPCGRKISLSALFRLAKLIREHDFQLVHSHGYKADTLALIVKAIAHPQVKLVSSCHSWKLNTLFEKIYRRLDLLVLRKFDAVVAISPGIRSELLEGGVKTFTRVIDNGIDLSQFRTPPDRDQVRASLGLSPDDLVIGCVASLTPEKRQCHLLQALTSVRHRKVKLVLVGDGPCQGDLKRMAAALGVEEDVLFLGHRSDARLLYFAFDIFALVSSREGLPMALLEAMAARLPVVASDVGAVPVVVDNGINGLLVPSGAVGEISSAICALAGEKEVRRRLGSAAFETVSKCYSSEAMCKEYGRIYSWLLPAHGR